MSKLQELTKRQEELKIKIAHLWDELIEVNECITVIEEAGDVKKNTKRVTKHNHKPS